MIYRHRHPEVDAIEMLTLGPVLTWLKPGEFNFVSNSLIIVAYYGDWYRAYFDLDYLIRDDYGVRPLTRVLFEATYQEIK